MDTIEQRKITEKYRRRMRINRDDLIQEIYTLEGVRQRKYFNLSYDVPQFFLFIFLLKIKFF